MGHWLLTLVLFGGDADTRPPEWVDDLPQCVKETVVLVMYDMGLSHPESADIVWYQDFAGTLYVFQRRYFGRPLPWPDDPVFGVGKPVDWGFP